jgi:hypothetical protein
MPPTDRLLRDLWRAIEHAGDVERELRATADQLAGWREVAQAAIAALDREIARSRDEDPTRTTVG